MNDLEEITPTLDITLAGDGKFYAIANIRECGLWLSNETYPLPVPSEWRRPGHTCACVIRGRPYYRIGTFGPQFVSRVVSIEISDPRIVDYRMASWWTPGLEECWTELDELYRIVAEGEPARKRDAHGRYSS